jgi:hypothetical protein
VRPDGGLALHGPEPKGEDRLRVGPERKQPVVDEERVDDRLGRDRATSGTDESKRGERRDR